MNDHICQLMVNHLNLNNDKDFAFLLIKSIKNGSITHSDEQCNFEILSEGFYPYIWKYTIRMPTSVYISDQ